MTRDVNPATLTTMTNRRVHTNDHLILDGNAGDRIRHLMRIGLDQLVQDRDNMRDAVEVAKRNGDRYEHLQSLAQTFAGYVNDGLAVTEMIDIATAGAGLDLALVAYDEFAIDEALGDLAEHEVGCDCGKGAYCPLVLAR